MNKSEVIEILQACLIAFDGGKEADYPQFNRDLWVMGKKLAVYLKKYEFKAGK